MAINDELRQEVIKRASDCCGYCRVSANERLLRFEIDHIIAIKHGGSDDSSNLAYACYKYNGFKGSNIAGADPLSQKATFLFNPCKDTWDEHFNIFGNGEIEALTPEARVTILMLRMNDWNRIHQRQGLLKLGKYPCKKE